MGVDKVDTRDRDNGLVFYREVSQEEELNKDVVVFLTISAEALFGL